MAKQKLVLKPQVPETLRKLSVGQHKFSCSEIGLLSTVRSAASRLNQQGGEFAYNAVSPDNGVTIVITKSLRP